MQVSRLPHDKGELFFPAHQVSQTAGFRLLLGAMTMGVLIAKAAAVVLLAPPRRNQEAHKVPDGACARLVGG